MTATELPRSDAPPRRSGFERDQAMRLAADEYARCADLMARLDPQQWSAPTVNTGWNVRDTAGHMLGMMQMMSSLAQLIGQMSTSMREARKATYPSRSTSSPRCKYDATPASRRPSSSGDGGS